MIDGKWIMESQRPTFLGIILFSEVQHFLCLFLLVPFSLGVMTSHAWKYEKHSLNVSVLQFLYTKMEIILWSEAIRAVSHWHPC